MRDQTLFLILISIIAVVYAFIAFKAFSPRIKGLISAHQIPAEAYYLQASREIKNGTINEGLWTKAWADANGNDTQAKALYLKYRVSALRAQAATKFTELSESESTPTAKTIVNCPKCSQKLRVDADKRLIVTCSKCGSRFETSI